MVSNEVALQREVDVAITGEISVKLRRQPGSAHSLYTWMAFQSKPGKEIDVFLEAFTLDCGFHITTARKAFAILVGLGLVKVLKRYTASIWKVVVYQYDPSTDTKAIMLAARQAKKRDGNRCQLTGVKSDKATKRTIHAHHIYSRNEFRVMSQDLDNLICLSSKVHSQFHGWNGGVRVMCNPERLIRFIEEVYPGAEQSLQAIQRLEEVKRIYRGSVADVIV